jgi:hypothetical protein
VSNSAPERDNKWFLPDLSPMQDALNENARRMAEIMRRGCAPVTVMVGTDGVPLADQEIPAEGTE